MFGIWRICSLVRSFIVGGEFVLCHFWQISRFGGYTRVDLYYKPVMWDFTVLTSIVIYSCCFI